MIQIDMPLPKCCGTCFALDDMGDYPFCLISKEQMGYTFNVNVCRMPHCPLKEQKPMKPQKTLDGNGNLWKDCGACGGVLPKRAQYCPTCGRKVMWDAPDRR